MFSHQVKFIFLQTLNLKHKHIQHLKTSTIPFNVIHDHTYNSRIHRIVSMNKIRLLE